MRIELDIKSEELAKWLDAVRRYIGNKHGWDITVEELVETSIRFFVSSCYPGLEPVKGQEQACF